MNTGKLAGRTLFVTGASRGIGLAIALKAAADGANIVIAAKTAEAHAKLPGTIHSAAEEIRKAGGKAMPCVVDVRNEEDVQRAVDGAVREFGGIDIVINNASAISLTPTLDTSMKKYDLMHQINTRGTFLVSQKCIPYLKQSKNAHILNISPPLNMNPVWFKNHVAYTMAKYGMSMCVLGMAEELRPFNIAVNALWPRTAIWTSAMAMLAGGSDKISHRCRKPEIMADAAYAILCRDARNTTGNFFIDEKLLHEQGVLDFSKYAVKIGQPLLPDFFLDDADPNILREKTPDGHQGAAPSAPKEAATGGGGVSKVFSAINSLLSEELVKKMNASYLFTLTGADKGEWFIDLKTARGGCGQGKPAASDVELTLDSADFVKMFRGELKPTAAFMTGKLKIKGDMGKAMKLEKLMGEVRSKI